MKRLSEAVSLLLVAVLALFAPVFAQLARAPQAPSSTVGMDVLLIEHTVDGVVESTGTLHRWVYAADNGGAHAVLCIDFTADGDLVMRDGFDHEVPSCP